MSLLRAASRALASSTSISQTSLPALVSRAYSTEPAQPPSDIHKAQRAARPRSLRQVSEQGGAMGKLIALAVNNTAQAGGRPRQRRDGQQQGQGQGQGRNRQRSSEGGDAASPRPPRSPRQRSGPAAVDNALLEGDASASQATGQQQQQQQRRPRRFNNDNTTPRTNLGSALSSRRSASSPEASALREGGFRQRSSRREDGASASTGGAGGARKPRAPLRPKTARPARPSLSASFSAEDTKPLSLPSSVRTPSANLARLCAAVLAEKTLQVKAAVGEKVVNEDAETAEAREAARKILGGDYSIWAEAGKEVSKGAKGKEQPLEHARGILKLNPSVGIDGRQALLNKVKEALL